MPGLGPGWFRFLDILFSLLFVGPFTVLYWRGTFVSTYNIFISGIEDQNPHYCITDVFLCSRLSCQSEMAALTDPLHYWAEHEDPGGLDQAQPEGEAGE